VNTLKKAKYVKPDIVKARTHILGRVIFLFSIQVLLASLILFEAVKNYGSKTTYVAEWQGNWIMLARFICGILMHINLVMRVKQGMSMMKYSLNHPWKFSDWRAGFAAGFLQTNVALLIEIVNYVSIVTHFEVIDIAMKFMTLMILMTFSEMLYASYDEDT